MRHRNVTLERLFQRIFLESRQTSIKKMLKLYKNQYLFQRDQSVMDM